MNDVLVVVFETQAVAVRVRQQLLGVGFAAPDVAVLTMQAAPVAPAASSGPAARREGDVLDRLRGLFDQQGMPRRSTCMPKRSAEAGGC